MDLRTKIIAKEENRRQDKKSKRKRKRMSLVVSIKEICVRCSREEEKRENLCQCGTRGGKKPDESYGLPLFAWEWAALQVLRQRSTLRKVVK